MRKFFAFLFLDNFPFSVTKVPFFYGHVIILCTSLIFIVSLIGQSTGLSVLMAFFKEHTQMTSLQVSYVYSVSAAIASLCVVQVGRMYDKLGSRRSALFFSFGLMAALFFSAWSHYFIEVSSVNIPKSAQIYLQMIISAINFFLLRLFGFCALTLVARNTLNKWFYRYRGAALGLANFASQIVYSISPYMLHVSLKRYGWQATWMSMGLWVGICFSLICWLFLRDRPQLFGMLPDGKFFDPLKEENEILRTKQYTPQQAFRTYTFWLYSCSFAQFSLLSTAVGVHMMSIFSEFSVDAESVVWMFIPIGIIGAIVNIVSSVITDKIRIKVFLQLHLLFLIFSIYSFIHFDKMYYLFVFSLACNNGLQGTLESVVWARFYGVKYVGEISATASSLMLFSSSLGPIIFSLSYQIEHTYLYAKYLLLGPSILLFLISLLFAATPLDQPQSTES